MLGFGPTSELVRFWLTLAVVGTNIVDRIYYIWLACVLFCDFFVKIYIYLFLLR